MSNTPDSTIFGKMTSRAAGKRQIKPTAVLYATLNDNHSSDEEDEDFEIQMGNTREKSGSGSSSGSSSGSDEENSDEEESEDSDDAEEKEDVEGGEISRKNKESAEKEAQMICGVCVNAKNPETAGEFMQCDKCGIHVHESCYQGLQLDDPEETQWFCEPCSAGLTNPPHCEFCPSRLGAFKESDIPGRWCHLICALFTHGVTFVQPETLTGASWENLENSLFGKKTCSACSDKIEARVGIASRCESGMCKEYMHVTCAQKLGLLVDETDDHESADAVAVMRYFFCKKHTNHDNLKTIQKKYLAWEKQETKRMLNHRRRRPLTENEDKNRGQIHEKVQKLIRNDREAQKRAAGGEIAADRQKQARLLNSSAEFYDRFETKAEDSGVSREAFREPFFNIKLTNTTHIPIGFSKEYLDYMHMRDTSIIPDEEEKLRRARETLAENKEKHAKNANAKGISEKLRKNTAKIDEKQQQLDELYSVLAEIADKNDDITQNWLEQQFGCSRKKMEKNGTSSLALKQEIYRCVVCEKTTDQHKQTQCDECHKSYHIGCLTPPLTRLPKRNNFGWICHVCNESSDEDEESVVAEDDPSSSSRTTRSRRPPARLSSIN